MLSRIFLIRRRRWTLRGLDIHFVCPWDELQKVLVILANQDILEPETVVLLSNKMEIMETDEKVSYWIQLFSKSK